MFMASARLRLRRVTSRLAAGAGSLVLLTGYPALAADRSVCATVQMEIGQELTLERQAFEARLRINNGYEALSLDDVSVDLVITDAAGAPVLFSSDPDQTDALFFVTLAAVSNLTDVAGAGIVNPATAAGVCWRLVPAPGAGGESELATPYYVGATLRYRIGGRALATEVAPDAIYVLPMPELVLDYFLPGPVQGDDPFTTEVEAPLPFTMGLRVLNVGAGTARGLRLSSGAPEITDNRNGLGVAFTLTAAEVNGRAAAPALLVDLGDLPGGDSAVARWTMTSSLSGVFTNFEAALSHADALGGELTALIRREDVSTHLLIRDVLVDAPGSDATRDFLADDGRVYESGGEDAPVTDASGSARLAGAAGLYALTFNAPTGAFVHIVLPNPEPADNVLREVVRSDGKRINAANAWLSQQQNAQHEWDHFFHLFDVAGAGCSYTVQFEAPAAVNHAPVLRSIGPKAALASKSVSFNIAADDADGEPPVLTTGLLPVGVSFLDNGDGTGAFLWTPTPGQIGSYRVRFTASDGALSDSETITLAVNSSDRPRPKTTVFTFR